MIEVCSMECLFWYDMRLFLFFYKHSSNNHMSPNAIYFRDAMSAPPWETE